ncbi:ABC transporter ATP-binding protein [Alkalitalea saponilacus]|uniref:ABC-2 type transport system ATP-binding protein n=1 Tax=Alkalitalea saponilacus TaxID=889453 RepID=A0A1T5CDI8_9BACT|nr:ATP-binding cassette domain-containing protein [Alkalitalea saponilacus]ASB49832.1 ABC transporter ATP-binding protein [Alkalitalea saponilacus]SKB57592.1 ABC-2 type transport system ATP-binding protein [Alkalitalea saponilacus]
MAKQEILKVEGLRKRFKDIDAVNKISFSVAEGDVFAFLGPNGAGKTTTIRILMDIIHADEGAISWNLKGQGNGFSIASLLGYLPEERGLYLDLPVINSLIYLAGIRGMQKSKAKIAAMHWLEKLELADRANEKLQALSKGNQQKIQFIASILHEPEFVILDEPFSGFDPINQEKFIEFIKEINYNGTTVLLSAHQMPLVEKVANKVFLINDGCEIYNGSLSDIYNKFGDRMVIDLAFEDHAPLNKVSEIEEVEDIESVDEKQIKVTFMPGTKMEPILNKLSGFAGITEFRTQKYTLHDIFLNLVKNHRS